MSIKQVCTHGLVTFGSAITNTSGSIPRDTGPPFIAANWYRFRTYNSSNYSNKGRVYYRSTSSGRIVRATLIGSENISRDQGILRKTWIYYCIKAHSIPSPFHSFPCLSTFIPVPFWMPFPFPTPPPPIPFRFPGTGGNAQNSSGSLREN